MFIDVGARGATVTAIVRGSGAEEPDTGRETAHDGSQLRAQFVSIHAVRSLVQYPWAAHCGHDACSSLPQLASACWSGFCPEAGISPMSPDAQQTRTAPRIRIRFDETAAL
jgi:hypothetical protein